MSIRIAIQGGVASFHDMAARQYFSSEKIEIYPCRTFRGVCEALLNNEANRAVMAIENSLNGSILPNYALLSEFPFAITGEIYMRIQQNLMALPGQSLADIQTVRSHPIALIQCSDYLENHPHLKPQESHDTAESAREIHDQQLTGVAAIAGKLAADLYDLYILEESIENVKKNYTRFIVLEKTDPILGMESNKASLGFHVRHEVGALASVITAFAGNGLNLGLIQSVPIPGHPDEYAFHVDVEWQQKEAFSTAIKEIDQLTTDLRILGIYTAGVRPSGYQDR